MNFGSVFSGIGGTDLGLERAGMRCSWQIESNPKCRAILRKRWPDAAIFGDVRGGLNLQRVDLIAGSPPCQPFSSASHGKRRGTEDDRWLWPEMFRIVKALGPSWVLVENVTHFDGPALEQVVSDLEGDGYEVSPPLEVPACAFGYDHRRPRLWILGYADRYRQSGLPVDAEVAVLPVGGRSEPDELGEEDGVPGWMDRLGMLGNAVVPSESEWIGQAIMRANS